MAINYPGGIDNFTVPSLPEATPLSEAGDGTRNHTSSIKDQGLAITALETNTAKRGHDHSGDAADTSKGAKLLQANTHQSVDTDASTSAIHHTIGTGANQAAPGNHNHDYNNLLNVPWKVCTSSSRPTTPFEGQMIFETDTHRFRQWGVYPNNTLVTGLFAVDYFNRTSTANIDSSLWDFSYDTDPATHGKAATPDGNTMSWIDGGTATNRMIARRINAADAVTASDDQVLTWKTGATVIEWEIPLIGDGATNDGYMRMSADKNSYIRIKVGFDYFKVFYTTTGKAGEQPLGTLDNVNTDIPNAEWRAEFVDRTLSFFRNGESIGAVTDTKALTAKGAAFRGWGVGMVAGQWGFGGQATPANVDWVKIEDFLRYSSVNRWTILPIAGQPSCRLRQSKKQKLLTTGTILEWGEVVEDNFSYFHPGAPSAILIREPGMYRVEAALQWDPALVPDVGHAIVMINGVETNVRDSKFMRGNVNAGGTPVTPGFSQTLSLSAPLRFAENDILQIKAKYTASNSLLDQIFSWFDAPSKVNSRLDLTYVGP